MVQHRRDAEELAIVPCRQASALIDDEGVREARRAGVLHVRKVTESIGIGERTVLAEALLVVASLDIMKATRVAAVVPAVDAPLAVDLDAESIAAAFREDLVTPLLRMVAPDELPH